MTNSACSFNVSMHFYGGADVTSERQCSRKWRRVRRVGVGGGREGLVSVAAAAVAAGEGWRCGGVLGKHKHIFVFPLMYSSASSTPQLWAKLLSAPVLCTQMSGTRAIAG